MPFDASNERHPITAYWLKRARAMHRDSDELSLAHTLYAAHREGEGRAFAFAAVVIETHGAKEAAMLLRREHNRCQVDAELG